MNGEPQAGSARTRVAAVVSTAGHVDHGKTTLVRALTGMETDRLPEEQARGISIELGFAWVDRPAGRIAFIDVPGHERFVRQMVAGATGIDAVVLVVAADEGVMPQTREHLAICGLLGLRRGIVVLSRVDKVDAEFAELAVDDVAAAVAGTFLEGAPVVAFSAHDPGAAARVLAALDAVVAGIERDDLADRPFVLAIDRTFSKPGFGTIATGTTRAGTLAVGDEVCVGDQIARVRGLEQHGEAVASVGFGQRVAVNLVGVAADLQRGARIVHRGGLEPQSMWDVHVSALASLPFELADGEKGLACFGATVVEASLNLLDRATLAPGADAFAQLRLSDPVALLPGERWVFRGFRALPDGAATLAGGRVLAPALRRRKRRDGVNEVAKLEGPVVDAVAAFVASRGEAGASTAELHAGLPWPRAMIDAAATRFVSSGRVRFARPALSALLVHVEATLEAFHRSDSAAQGMPLDELRTRVRPASDPAHFQAMIDAFVAEGRLARHGTLIARTGHKPTITLDQNALDAALLAQFTAAGLMPPRVDELVVAIEPPPSRAQIDVAIQRLVVAGKLVRVLKDMPFAAAALQAFEAKVRQWFAQHEWLDAQGLKDLTGATRKWSIPLGEWLDRARVTLRIEDRRKLR